MRCGFYNGPLYLDGAKLAALYYVLQRQALTTSGKLGDSSS